VQLRDAHDADQRNRQRGASSRGELHCGVVACG
jgi:hypothetical protein